MSSFFALFRISIVNYFSLTAMRIKYLRNKERLWEPVLIAFAILTLVASFGTGIYFVANAIITSAPPGQSDLGLTLPILLTQVMALFMGLFTLISLFYFSNDLDILVPLPLKEKYILATKLALANITEYIPALFIMIPPLVAYNQFIPLGVAGLLSAIVVFLFAPLLPLSMAGILVVTVMRGINRRHRDIMVIISSLLLLAIIMYVQYLFQSAAVNSVDLESVLQNRVDLVRLIGAAFPPSVWATRAISRAGEIEGLINLGLLCVSSIAGLVAFLSVGQRVFYGGLIGGGEHARKNVAFTQTVLAQQANASPLGRALFLREWKLFIRVPIWVLNGFIAVLLVPLMALFPAFTGGQGLSQLVSWAENSAYGLSAATIIFAAMIASLSSLNTLASTSVSREGKHLWISRVLPISAKDQVMAKIKHAALASIIIAAPLTLMYYLVFKPTVFHLVTAFTLGIVAGAAPQLLGMLYDMWRPFLTWTNPQHAVKNNLNAVFPMLIMIPLGFASYFAFKRLVVIMSEVSLLLTLIVAHLAVAVASLYLVLSKAENLYHNIEL